MLQRRLLSPTLLEVVQTICGFNCTRTTYWYYDTENWLRSQLGKKDEKPSVPMDQESIDWCKKHHIPKAERAY